MRQTEQLVHSVVEQADLNALLRFFLEDFQHGFPHISRIDNKKLDKDKFFRAAQLLQQRFKSFLPAGEIFCRGIPVDGASAGFSQIGCQVRHLLRFLLQHPFGFRILLHQRRCFRLLLQNQPVKLPASNLLIEVQIKQRAEYRNRQNRHYPGYLERRITPPADNHNHKTESQEYHCPVCDKYIVPYQLKADQQNAKLNQNHQKNDAGPAENNVQHSLFALLQLLLRLRQQLFFFLLFVFHIATSNPLQPSFPEIPLH